MTIESTSNKEQAMKLAIFGGTGRTGRAVIDLAIVAGHDVTALLRGHPRAALPPIRVIQGLVTEDADAVSRTVAGQDAVLVTLGPRSPFDGAVMTASIERIAAAMAAEGVQRLVVLSALGLGDKVPAPALMRFVGRTLRRRPAADKRASERLLDATELDWVAVYPGSLTREPGTGGYRVNPSESLRGVPKIARADVARCLLDEAERPTIHRAGAVVVRA
jgi:putative NADH-flavin reductase